MADSCSVSLLDNCVRRPSLSCCSSPAQPKREAQAAARPCRRTVALLQPLNRRNELIKVFCCAGSALINAGCVQQRGRQVACTPRYCWGSAPRVRQQQSNAAADTPASGSSGLIALSCSCCSTVQVCTHAVAAAMLASSACSSA